VALKSELMALGMQASLAKRLGFDPPANFTAAGTAQIGATVLTSNHAIVATSGGATAVVMADVEQMYFITLTTSTSALVFPPSGANFTGLSANASITVPQNKSLFIEPAGSSGIAWSVSA
jgi:hypothetical protein